MNLIIKITACFGLLWFVSLGSCRKDPPNRSPIANAGLDIVIVLPTCGDDTTVFAELDGTGSVDPDNNIVNYQWVFVSGPGAFYLKNSASAKTRVEKLVYGEYVFELKVVDEEGLQSKDIITIRVDGTPKEYQLDINFNGSFSFIDDFGECSPYNYYNYCSYSDLTRILSKGQFLPLGEFNINVSESADEEDQSDIHYTAVHIYHGNINGAYIVSGYCSVNFKKLIKQGGGLFNGNISLTDGSVLRCDENVFANLPLLMVTGNLDTVAKTVSMRIKGKVYF